MAIVTVKNKYQVVIPRDLREKLRIGRGDLLEAKVERGRLTYTPKSLIDRIPAGKAERARFFKKLRDEAPAWLKEMWAASRRHGTDKLTMREINAEIAAVRRASKKVNQPAR
jgi:AbrB family looped-hinge helix DNA binding protein